MNLPLALRAGLFSAGFSVKERSLKEVPSFSLSDLGLLPLLGLQKSLGFFGYFQGYRNHMQAQARSSLTSIYPRSYYLLYFFILFWWGDYCGTLEGIVASPDRSRLAELFFRYIIEADRLIDESPEAYLKIKTPSLMKHSPAVSETLRAFLGLLSELELAPETRHQACHHFWRFRNECLDACRSMLPGSETGLRQVLDFKERTTGGLFRTWSALLSELYVAPASRELSDNCGLVLYQAAMAMQVWEDLLDLPADCRLGVPNIVYEIIKTHPDELIAFGSYRRQYNWQHMDGIWARQNLPRSFRQALELVDGYVAAAMQVSLLPEKAADLCYLINRGQSHPVGI